MLLLSLLKGLHSSPFNSYLTSRLNRSDLFLCRSIIIIRLANSKFLIGVGFDLCIKIYRL